MNPLTTEFNRMSLDRQKQAMRTYIRNQAGPAQREVIQELDINLLNHYINEAVLIVRNMDEHYDDAARDTFHKIFGYIIYIVNVGFDVEHLILPNPVVQEVAIRYFYKIKPHFDGRRQNAITEARERHQRQAATEKERAIAAIKKQKEKKANRKNNKFCKNETEFFTIEDIEDIPTEELTFIKFGESIYCLDHSSYTNMLKFSADQKVRGNCKPPVRNRPLKCDWFYPINIGINVFINEKNYKKRVKETKKRLAKQNRKFILKNKKRVNFTTGLHIMSQKTGFDDVYDLEPTLYPTDNAAPKKLSKKKQGQFRKYTVKQLKAECKKKGIKGYSKLKKAELINFCSVTDAISGTEKAKKGKKITVKELKVMCKKLKIKGYSKWRKAELLKKCGPKNSPPRNSQRRSPGGISGLAPNAPLPLN
jgi:hypothetical protein